MSRKTLTLDEYDSLEFDHAVPCEGGRTLMDNDSLPIGNLYYSTTVSDALKNNSLEFEPLDPIK